MTKLVTFTCPQCGRDGHKELGAVNHASKAGRNIYCSRKCSVLGRSTRTPEMLVEYQRKYREANRENLKQYARDYRSGENRERALELQRASHQRNRESNAVRMKEYAQKNRASIEARIKRWLKANPDKADLYSAKANLSASLGIRVAEVPNDLAEAKVAQWRIMRWVRETISERAENQMDKNEILDMQNAGLFADWFIALKGAGWEDADIAAAYGIPEKDIERVCAFTD